MTGRAPLGAFLRSRRERLTPASVGITVAGRRRARGLRREEVATLAGISAAWYTHLKQGREVRPSPEVLDAIGEALRLSGSERRYLFQLAYGVPASDRGNERRPARQRETIGTSAHAAAPHPDGVGRHNATTIRQLVDAFGLIPALVVDRCWDVVDHNAALAAMRLPPSPGHADTAAAPYNAVAYLLTSGAVRAAVPNWACVARLAVDGLRASMAGLVSEHPGDPRAEALVRALERASPEFRIWWPEHDIWAGDTPVIEAYEHPHVGRIEFVVTLLDIRSAPGLTLITCIPRDAASAARSAMLRSHMAEPQSERVQERF